VATAAEVIGFGGGEVVVELGEVGGDAAELGGGSVFGREGGVGPGRKQKAESRKLGDGRWMAAGAGNFRFQISDFKGA
jgi:hypothetical protein